MAEQNGQRPIRQRIADAISGDGAPVHVTREIIGRNTLGTVQASIYRSRSNVRTVDETVPHYEFWDKLRRGKAKGYSLGGLFARRVEQIFASWTLGRGVDVTLVESGDAENEADPRNYTDGLLADFLNDNHALLMQTERDKLGLGDQYVIVNADGTLSVPSPDTVEQERDPLDYRNVTATIVTTKLDKATIVDRYEADGRTVTIRQRDETGNMRETVQTFPNLIGRIPVVHLAHDRSANETNGRPIHEALRPLYDQYDDTIYKQLDGAKLLGNPIPTFKNLMDVQDALGDNDPAEQDTYYDKDGNLSTRTQINLDHNSLVLLGENGDFFFAAPPTGFTADTQQALKTLFLLLLDHTGIPEFVWGNEMSSSRSSAEVQMTQFVRDIEARQKDDETWLLELCEIWLLTTALTDGRVVLDDLQATWPPLIEEDETIQLERIKFAKGVGLLTDKTALELLNLVEDAEKEVTDAQAETEARMESMFPEGDSTMFQQRLGAGEGEQGE